MKKTFQFKVPNMLPVRQMDEIRREVNKYLARERKKTKPENGDYWGFDCKIGDDAKSAVKIPVDDVSAKIQELALAGNDSFYLEIIAKPESKPVRDYAKKPEKKRTSR